MDPGRARVRRAGGHAGRLPRLRRGAEQGSDVSLTSDDTAPPAGSVAAGASGAQAPLVDVSLALRTASLLAPAKRPDAAAVESLREAVAADLPAIDAAARRFTALGADLPPTTIRIVGRTGWMRANLDVVSHAFEPLRERLQQRPVATRRGLGIQLGVLFGLLSTKVLGQYVLPLAGPGSGQLLVVGPNVLELADQHGRLAEDIRRTVLLHEVTHRLQFDSTDWLGDHLRGLVERYLDNTRVDANQIGELVGRLPEAIAAAKRQGELRPLLEAVLTPEQVAVVAEAQGLMSLLEGHGNATMYGAGDDLITDPEGVREAMASRQGDVTSKVLSAIGGLEMKRRQYREGEQFVSHVLEAAGPDGLNQAFAAPENLPRGEEVADPDGWLARVSGP